MVYVKRDYKIKGENDLLSMAQCKYALSDFGYHFTTAALVKSLKEHAKVHKIGNVYIADRLDFYRYFKRILSGDIKISESHIAKGLRKKPV